MNLSSKFRISWTATVLLALGAAAFSALDYSRLARNFPLSAATAGVALASTLLILDVRRLRASGFAVESAGKGQSMLYRLDADGEIDDVEIPARVFAGRLLGYLATLIGYVALLAVFGIYVGSAVFLAMFLRFIAGQSWARIAVSITLTLFALQTFSAFIDLRWPTNLMGW